MNWDKVRTTARTRSDAVVWSGLSAIILLIITLVFVPKEHYKEGDELYLEYRILLQTGHEAGKCGEVNINEFRYYSYILEKGVLWDSWKSTGWCAKSKEESLAKVEEIVAERYKAEQAVTTKAVYLTPDGKLIFD